MASKHTYMVMSIPSGCGAYTVGDDIKVLVNDPPPNDVFLVTPSSCYGTWGELDEDDAVSRTPPEPSTDKRTYRFISVPSGCTSYKVGQEIQLPLPASAPKRITLVSDDACNGAVLERIQ